MMSKEKIESRFSELLSSLNFKTQGNHDLMRIDRNGFIERGSYKTTIIDSETGLKYKLQMIVNHTINANYLNSNGMLIVTNCKNNSSSSITFDRVINIKDLDNALHTLRKIIDGDVSYGTILKENILSISSKHRGHDRITVSRNEARQIMLYEILLNWGPSENLISSIDDIEDSFGSKWLLRSIHFRRRNLKMVNMVRSNSDCYIGMIKSDSMPFGMVFYLGDNVDPFHTHDRYFMLCWPNTDGMKALMDDDNITKNDNVSYYGSIESMLPYNGKKQSKSYVNYRNISLIEAMELYLIKNNRKDKLKTKIKDNVLTVKYNDNTSIIEFGLACSCNWRIDEENNMMHSIAVDLYTIVDFCSYYCEIYMSSKKVFDFICSKLREDGYNAEFNGKGAILIDDKMKPGLYIDVDFTDNFYLLGLRLMRSHYGLYRLEEMSEDDPYVNSGVISIRSGGGADSFMMDNWYRLRMFIDMVEHEVDPTHRTPGIEAED